MPHTDENSSSGDFTRDLLEARIHVLRIELAALEQALKSHTGGSRRQHEISGELSSPSDLIGAKEAAKLLGVSHKTITVYQQNGTIPGVRVGHNYKFSRSAIEKLLHNTNQKAGNTSS